MVIPSAGVEQAAWSLLWCRGTSGSPEHRFRFLWLPASSWVCTCFQGASCLTAFQMFLTSKCVANGMKIITGEFEAVGRRCMSKSLWYKSVSFSVIF